MKENDIQAFPLQRKASYSSGMTLRDYFAAKALSRSSNYKPKSAYQWIRWFFGLSFKGLGMCNEDNAREAYKLADEMLKQRNEDK